MTLGGLLKHMAWVEDYWFSRRLYGHDPQPRDQVAWRDGRIPSLRLILVHMIEEYARHNGHADLLREAVDGSTGH